MPKFNPISRLSERNQLLVLSLVVGIVVGLAAVLLKTLISLIQGGLHDAFEEVLGGTLYYLVLPGVGMLLAMLFCRFVIKDNIGHGVTKAAYRLKKSVSGLILIEPEVSESVSRLTPKLGYEVLTVSTSEKTSARIKILDYLEIRGALK